jgi:methionyl aminopeptidase
LLKVDIGVHLDGFVADTAFSLDLENNAENKALIAAAETALAETVALVCEKKTPSLHEIGTTIAKTLDSKGFQPIRNLSGHSIKLWDLHAGLTIPNYGNAQDKLLESGTYAIEPFATLLTGSGMVRDGKPSGIYAIEKESPVRDTFARQILAYIIEHYQTLPFCSRWLCKQFGTRSLIALALLEQAGVLHQYAQLIEANGKKVVQAEHTIIVAEKEVVVTTR